MRQSASDGVVWASIHIRMLMLELVGGGAAGDGGEVAIGAVISMSDSTAKERFPLMYLMRIRIARCGTAGQRRS
jgi:hypothetical protein